MIEDAGKKGQGLERNPLPNTLYSVVCEPLIYLVVKEQTCTFAKANQ